METISRLGCWTIIKLEEISILRTDKLKTELKQQLGKKLLEFKVYLNGVILIQTSCDISIRIIEENVDKYLEKEIVLAKDIFKPYSEIEEPFK